MLNTLDIRHKYIIFKENVVNFKRIVDFECLFKYVWPFSEHLALKG